MIRTTENTPKIREENWQDLWRPRCHSKGWAKQHHSITDVMQNNGNEKEFNTMCDCIVKSPESTRQRAESLQSRNHEDHIAGKGFTSMTHYNLVHMFIPMPSSDENFGCQKLPWTRNGRTRDSSGVENGKSQEQEGVLFWKHKETKRRSTLLH